MSLASRSIVAVKLSERVTAKHLREICKVVLNGDHMEFVRPYGDGTGYLMVFTARERAEEALSYLQAGKLDDRELELRLAVDSDCISRSSSRSRSS